MVVNEGITDIQEYWPRSLPKLCGQAQRLRHGLDRVDISKLLDKSIKFRRIYWIDFEKTLDSLLHSYEPITTTTRQYVS